MQKYTKRKDGRYRARVWDGTYVDGEKHYIDVYSTKSSRDLELKVKEIEGKRQIGAVAYDKNVDIYEYIVDWVERTKSSCEPSTKRFYIATTRNTLTSLKGLTFDNFTYNNIQDLFNEQIEHPANAEKMAVILKQVGKAAERDKLIPKGTTAELFEQIRYAKKKPKERKVLSKSDIRKVLEANIPPMEKMLVTTLYYTGLRRSEALALTVNDVKDGFITVNKALGEASTGRYVKSPKSARGNRRVPIPKELQEKLNEYIPTLDSEYLFLHKGKFVTQSRAEVITKHLRKASGVKHITLHALRHNYCTVLCYQSIQNGNISPKKIAELLGDREEMVMNVYSHIIEEKEKVSEAIENALSLTT